MGTGASAGISAGAGSRGLPPHPRQAWAADAERPQRADESSEGAGGEGCWREAGGAGGGLWAGPGKGRRAAGRSHRAHGVRALLPSEVTRREARGRGQGLAALSSPPPHKKDKRAPGRWEGKSFLLVSREISPPNLKPQALQRRLGAECRVQGWLPGGAPRDCDPGALQSPAAHDPWELPPPQAPAVPLSTRLLLEDADKIQSSPSRTLNPHYLCPSRKVALPEQGALQTKIYLWEQNTRSQELFFGFEGQRVKTDTPTRRARLSPNPRSQSLGPASSRSSGEAPTDSRFS